MIWLVAGLLVMFVAITLFYLRGEDLRRFDSPRTEPNRTEPAGNVDQPSDQHLAVLKEKTDTKTILFTHLHRVIEGVFLSMR